jgi:thioredoxin 1
MEVKLNDNNFEEQVLRSEVPVLVDFWADWCAPCRMIAPTVEEIAREYDGKLKVCKLNVDEGRNTASQYGIMSIPSLLIFKEGQVVEQIVGVVPKETLENKIKQHITESI